MCIRKVLGEINPHLTNLAKCFLGGLSPNLFFEDTVYYDTSESRKNRLAAEIKGLNEFYDRKIKYHVNVTKKERGADTQHLPEDTIRINLTLYKPSSDRAHRGELPAGKYTVDVRCSQEIDFQEDIQKLRAAYIHHAGITDPNLIILIMYNKHPPLYSATPPQRDRVPHP